MIVLEKSLDVWLDPSLYLDLAKLPFDLTYTMTILKIHPSKPRLGAEIRLFGLMHTPDSEPLAFRNRITRRSATTSIQSRRKMVDSLESTRLFSS